MTFRKLAGGAVKVAKNKLKVGHLNFQDYEDCVGAATLGMIKAQKSPKNESFYEFVAAKNEAMKFILSQIFEKGKTTRFEDYENYEAEPEFISQFRVNESLLTDMFLKHRMKRGRRGYEASKRDARICSLILQGYSNEGIAQELGQSPHNIRRYRTDIKKRLMKIARKTEKPD